MCTEESIRAMTGSWQLTLLEGVWTNSALNIALDSHLLEVVFSKNICTGTGHWVQYRTYIYIYIQLLLYNWLNKCANGIAHWSCIKRQTQAPNMEHWLFLPAED